MKGKKLMMALMENSKVDKKRDKGKKEMMPEKTEYKKKKVKK